jgi:hypothetical protein
MGGEFVSQRQFADCQLTLYRTFNAPSCFTGPMDELPEGIDVAGAFTCGDGACGGTCSRDDCAEFV